MNDREAHSSPGTGQPARGGGSFYRFDFVPGKGRVHARYMGIWTEDVARNALSTFRATLANAKAHARSFTLLDDFCDWEAQAPQVMDIANQFEKICHGFPISRNAMVIPNALVRRQVRRTVTEFHLCQIFQAYEDADRWLAEVEQGPDY